MFSFMINNDKEFELSDSPALLSLVNGQKQTNHHVENEPEPRPRYLSHVLISSLLNRPWCARVFFGLNELDVMQRHTSATQTKYRQTYSSVVLCHIHWNNEDKNSSNVNNVRYKRH